MRKQFLITSFILLSVCVAGCRGKTSPQNDLSDNIIVSNSTNELTYIGGSDAVNNKETQENTEKQVIDETVSSLDNSLDNSKDEENTSVEQYAQQLAESNDVIDCKTENSYEETNEYTEVDNDVDEVSNENNYSETSSSSNTVSYQNLVIKNYGSYENFSSCLFDEINKLRSGYGYSQLSTSYYTNDICYRVNQLGVSVGVTKHWTALDYPELTGLYRSAESCAYGDVDIYSDAASVANRLTLGHTPLIVTDPGNVYLAVSVIPYEKNGRKLLSITIDAWTQEDYNDYIVGSKSWTIGSGNRTLTQTSIYK